MSDKTKRVLLGLTSVGIAIFIFILADAAMPDEVKWFMRWWLAGVALVCYFAGAAYAAYLMRERISEIENGHAEVLKGKQAALDNEKRKNAKLAAILDERKRQEREQAQRNSLREWAFSLDASSKLLLLEAAQAEGEVAHVPARYDVIKARRKLSFEGNAAVYVSHIGNDEGGRGAYRVQISDFGRHVVAECGDILEEAKQYEESQKKAQNPC